MARWNFDFRWGGWVSVSDVRWVTVGMRVGIVAPPWIPVPPPAYGGTEAVIGSLVCGLSAKGIDVTLFAHPESTADVAVLSGDPPVAGVHMGDAMTELAWASAADVAL